MGYFIKKANSSLYIIQSFHRISSSVNLPDVDVFIASVFSLCFFGWSTFIHDIGTFRRQNSFGRNLINLFYFSLLRQVSCHKITTLFWKLWKNTSWEFKGFLQKIHLAKHVCKIIIQKDIWLYTLVKEMSLMCFKAWQINIENKKLLIESTQNCDDSWLVSFRNRKIIRLIKTCLSVV